MHRLTPKFALRYAALTASAAAIVSLSGCAGITGTALPTSSAMTIAVPEGTVHGGQQPIAFSHVYLYAAADTTTAIPASGTLAPCAANANVTYASAACSLLPSAPSTTVDSNGNYYLTTDGSGYFKYGNGLVTCPSSDSQIYILAVGGNATGYNPGPTSQGQNSAIALSAALGTCSNITASTFTSINEVTTAAMAFSLGQFMTDGTHVGAPTTGVTALKNAFLNVGNLVDNSTGTALTVTPATLAGITIAGGGNGTPSTSVLNAIANMLSACVNSGISTSTACGTLLTHTPNGSGVSPNDTLTAVVNLAANPAENASTLYTLIAANPPFQPSYTTSSQPTDFSVSISYAAPAAVVGQGGSLAIDGSGNIWVTNCRSCITSTLTDSIIEYGPMGNYLGSYGTGAIANPKGLAIDASSANLYITNQTTSAYGNDKLVRMPLATPAANVTITDPSFFYLSGVTLDNSGNVWVTNGASVSNANNWGSVDKIVSPTAATPTVTSFDYTSSSTISQLSLPLGIGVDTNGFIWVAATNSQYLNSGSASSGVITPPAIAKFTSTGAVGYYTASQIPGLIQPLDISITGSNQIVTVDAASSNNAISIISDSGHGQSYGSIGLFQSALTAVDGANNILIPSCARGPNCTGYGGTDALVRIPSSGTGAISVKTPAFNGTVGIGIDAGGNAWVSNYVDGTITEVLGFAAPTVNPLAASTTAGTLGTRP